MSYEVSLHYAAQFFPYQECNSVLSMNYVTVSLSCTSVNSDKHIFYVARIQKQNLSSSHNLIPIDPPTIEYTSPPTNTIWMNTLFSVLIHIQQVASYIEHAFCIPLGYKYT